MARVTGVGKGPEFPNGEGPRLSSTLATNVAQTGAAAEKAWFITGHASLAGRVTVGPLPEDRL